MDAATRELVRGRASRRCEYCGIHEDDDWVLPFHVEHIRPRKHGGGDDAPNLALACNHCNLHKGTNLSGIDPASDAIVVLFHPRQQQWTEHFRTSGGRIEGLTAVGRATISVLAMNRTDRIELRRALAD
jgi:5-methylcytosine-specific restriction endonuclease McrA